MKNPSTGEDNVDEAYRKSGMEKGRVASQQTETGVA
jgi:hypothetical protein